jgi:histidyl-tRNA synthetase
MKMSFEEIIKAIPESKRNELIKYGIDEIVELGSYLDDRGIKDILRFTPSLTRGLEIYTGAIWEVFLQDGSITSSVGAGGRYDKIIGSFIDNGKEYPAVGMTFGLDVIYYALKIQDELEYVSPVKLYVIPLGTEKECFEIVTKLRQKGISVDMAMQSKRLSKSLDYANKAKIPCTVIIGENEISIGKVKLKNMVDGTEEEINIDEIAQMLIP